MAKITVSVNRLTQHSGDLYDVGTTITDEEELLKQALESGAVTKAKAPKSKDK